MNRRNTPQFTFLAWTAFAIALSMMIIGIYTLEEPLSVKGYYLMGTFFLSMSAFVLQKVIRDNAEDDYKERERLGHTERSERNERTEPKAERP